MRWNVDSGLNTEKNLKTVGGFSENPWIFPSIYGFMGWER